MILGNRLDHPLDFDSGKNGRHPFGPGRAQESKFSQVIFQDSIEHLRVEKDQRIEAWFCEEAESRRRVTKALNKDSTSAVRSSSSRIHCPRAVALKRRNR